MKFCPVCEKSYDDAAEVCPADGAVLKFAAVRRDPLVGSIIKGRYRVVRKLGAGGMGTVYLAEQLSIGRNVALKVLHAEFARDEEFIKRFHQEARLAATLSHRNVVTVHDFDQADDGSLFIVMEYVEGRNLKEVVLQGPLDVGRALQLGIQIAEGLGAAHRAGVIHRDIKPENIMLVAVTDEVKLMDFGIARLRETGTMSRLTRSGIIMGTPAYMAPEQIEGQDVSVKTDIYAFGVVLYEMLTGVVPFEATTPSAVLIKHLQEQPLPIRNLRTDIPSSVERVVMQALQKRPEQRQKSLTEVAKELEEAARQLHGITPAFRSGVEARSREFQSGFTEKQQVAESYRGTGAAGETQGVAETLAETRRLALAASPKARKWKYFGIGAAGVFLAGAAALGIYFGVTWLGAPHVVSLTIEADRSRLELSERTRVRLRALHSDGAERQLIEGIQWQSSDSSVATVSVSGEVEGIKPGGTEITALYGGKRSNPLWVAVNPREPVIESREPPIREIANLAVLARKNTINVGERIELAAVATYPGGAQEKNLKDVTWESSDPGVANIDASGKLQGLREGQVQITARYGDKAHSMIFTIHPAVQLASLAIDVEKTELKINERMAATVKGTYSDGRVATVSKGLKWKSGDPSIAEVDPEGQVMAHKSGNVAITASYGTVQSQPLTLSVLPDAPKLSGLRIYVREKVLKVGQAVPLRVTGQYSDGKEVEISHGVSWHSTDKTIAEVSSQAEGRSVVIGRGPGKAVISGTYEGAVSPRLAFVVTDAVASKKKDIDERVSLGRYRVIRPTAVLTEARKDSSVVANLSPGITVNVVGASGDYFRIESKTGRPPGYILRGDVEPAEEKGSTSGQRVDQTGVARPFVGARWANSRSEAGRLALADCGQGGDGCRIIRSVCTTKARSPQYGAIAYSLTRRVHGYSVDYADRGSAEARALSECGADCKIAVWFRNACAVLAVGQAR